MTLNRDHSPTPLPHAAERLEHYRPPSHDYGRSWFIGSTLARRLVDLGADVLLVDALLADRFGHFHNISGIENLLSLRILDVRLTDVMNDLVGTQQIIFNLAGQVSSTAFAIRKPISRSIARAICHCLKRAGGGTQLRDFAAGRPAGDRRSACMRV